MQSANALDSTCLEIFSCGVSFFALIVTVWIITLLTYISKNTNQMNLRLEKIQDILKKLPKEERKGW